MHTRCISSARGTRARTAVVWLAHGAWGARAVMNVGITAVRAQTLAVWTVRTSTERKKTHKSN